MAPLVMQNDHGQLLIKVLYILSSKGSGSSFNNDAIDV